MNNTMTDEIKIEGLTIFAHHGVYPEEAKLGQTFIVNAVLFTDTRAAGLTDDLSQSVNYGTACSEIYTFLTEHTYKLLEAAVEHLAAHLLHTFPLVHGVELELKKPGAPIRYPFDSVSVKIRREWKRAAISYGSNMGDKKEYIEDALRAIDADENVRIVRCSEIIETEPYGGVEQDVFLNGAAVLETLYDPEGLLHFLQSLEQKAGRERLVHWGPRTLDLDIVFYEDDVIRSDDLIVPHIDMHNRAFVLEPLAEVAPGWIHPIYGKSVSALLEELKARA